MLRELALEEFRRDRGDSKREENFAMTGVEDREAQRTVAALLTIYW